MAKEEDKGAAKPADGGAKPPMFSKTGLIVLLGACALSAGVPAVMMAGKKAPADPGGHAEPMPAPEDHADHPVAAPHAPPGALPVIRNTVTLEPIQVNYRDTGSGGPRRSMNLTVVLGIMTQGGGGEHPDPKAAKSDDDRKKAVEKLVPWIRDRIIAILRGKGPEDFATNEMIEQVKQQIRHSINNEFFGKQDVIQDVLFPEQRF